MDMIQLWETDAAALDNADVLAKYRNDFHFPLLNGKLAVYLTGNSLGLQPKSTQRYLDEELKDWQSMGVEGHMSSRRPWYSYHRQFKKPLSQIVGALEHEVVAMNSLTVNLHLMLVTFYRPTSSRYKIIMAGNEFPSDRYAIESQIRMHGYDPSGAMIEVDDLSDENIVSTIQQHGSSVALVLFSGVHFYSGKFFDIASIAKAAHDVGAYAGFDLAHAVGNVELKMHDWDADFAVWCSYKYLNSGPGGVGGAYIHERYADRPDMHRLAGWWGNDEDTRFDMVHDFIPTYGADSWQLSNAPVLAMAAHKAALEIFMNAGMQNISAKRNQLTGFAERLILDVFKNVQGARILTPSDVERRGAQLSLQFAKNGRHVFESIMQLNIIVDWRTPDVIRVAPAPLYNSFADVLAFGKALHKATS